MFFLHTSGIWKASGWSRLYDSLIIWGVWLYRCSIYYRWIWYNLIYQLSHYHSLMSSHCNKEIHWWSLVTTLYFEYKQVCSRKFAIGLFLICLPYYSWYSILHFTGLIRTWQKILSSKSSLILNHKTVYCNCFLSAAFINHYGKGKELTLINGSK